MTKLKDIDPEFYTYLAKHDSNLLDFADTEVIDDSSRNDRDSAFDNEEGSVQNSDDDKHHDIEVKNVHILGRIVKKATSGSLLSLQRLSALFKRMANSTFSTEGVNLEDKLIGDTISGKDYGLTLERVSIILSAAYIGLCAASEIPPEETSLQVIEAIRENIHEKKIKALVESFFKTALKVLNCLNLASSEHIEFTFHFLPKLKDHQLFLIAFPSTFRLYFKALVRIWVESLVSQSHSCCEVVVENLRSLIFLAAASRVSGVDEGFKMLYNSFTNLAKDVKDSDVLSRALDSIILCYSSDFSTAYQQCFLYIRQLSLHLRIATLKSGDISTKAIKSLGCLWSLRLWTRMASQLSKVEIGFSMFSYPLVQIALGIYKLVSSVYFLPFRLHLIHELQIIASSFNIFVPTNKLLLEVAEAFCKMCENSNKSVSTQPFDMNSEITFPNNSLESLVVKSAVLEDLVAKVRAELKIHGGESYFPESFFILTRKLKSCCRKLHDLKYQKLLKALINHLIYDTFSEPTSKNKVETDFVVKEPLLQEPRTGCNDSIGEKRKMDFEQISGDSKSTRKKRRVSHDLVVDKVSPLQF